MKNQTFPDRIWVEFESDAGPMTGMTGDAFENKMDDRDIEYVRADRMDAGRLEDEINDIAYDYMSLLEQVAFMRRIKELLTKRLG